MEFKDILDKVPDFINNIFILNIKFKKLLDNAIIPSFKKDGDSGFDFYSCHNTIIEYGKISVVDTGLSVELPSQIESFPYTYEMQIRPRSGLSMKEGLIVVNTPGTIDNGYTGPILILMTRLIPGKIELESGSRIAQGVICPILSSNILNFVEVDKLNNTDRGDLGFGSTGIK